MSDLNAMCLTCSDGFLALRSHQNPSPIDPGQQPEEAPPIEPDRPEPIEPPNPEPEHPPVVPPLVPPIIPPALGFPSPAISLLH